MDWLRILQRVVIGAAGFDTVINQPGMANRVYPVSLFRPVSRQDRHRDQCQQQFRQQNGACCALGIPGKEGDGAANDDRRKRLAIPG